MSIGAQSGLRAQYQQLGQVIDRQAWRWAKSGTRQWRLAEATRHLPLSTSTRYRYLLVDRPNYAYGVHRAVTAAANLLFPAVTVVEFGVAGGNGLVALEQHARLIGRAHGVAVKVIGFDTGKGMRPPVDYRDQPHFWAEGNYRMNEAALRARLRSADVIIGDVGSTLPRYLDEHRTALAEAPVGFVSFDLDYYSSTMHAFDLFRAPDISHLLPRVGCYFDDTIFSIPAVGELRAIADFNDEKPSERAIGPICGLRAGLPFDPPWADQFFEAHSFGHALYARTSGIAPEQLPLDRRR